MTAAEAPSPPARPAIRPGSLGAWRLATRPPTLTAAIAPVLAGTGAAIAADSFRVLPALAALFGAVCLQVGANLANDVFDHERGADTADRLGPPRAAQTGLLTPGQLRAGMAAMFALATVAGVYLVFAAGWPVVVVGVSSIVAAVIYTGGPWPTGYHALGDLFTFVFFGVVAVTGTYYVQANELSGAAWFAALPMGCTVTAILVINNLRDIPTDRATGKTTLGVLIGERATRGWYVFLLAAAFVLALAMWPLGLASVWVALALLALPVAWPLARTVTNGTTGRALNPTLKATARFDLVFAALFALGLALSR